MLLTAKSETKRYKSLHTQALSKGGFGKIIEDTVGMDKFKEAIL